MAHLSGIVFKQFPVGANNKPFAELVVLRSVENVDADKFKKSGVGFDTEIPYQGNPIVIDFNYAKEIEKAGCFVPLRDYKLRFDSLDDDPYFQVVVELIPTDDDVKKLFTDSKLNIKK